MAIKVDTDSFIFGKDAYPDWFKVLSDKGLIQYFTDKKTGSLLGGKYLGNPAATFKTGYTLMYMNGVLNVLTEDEAKKYKVEN